MTVTSLLSRLRERMRAFCAADAGNVAITFALATIPIIGFTGAAIDYSRANSARTAMQAAADSTALILSKEAQGLTDAQLKEKALKYFVANFNRSEVKNIVVTPVYKVVEKGSFKLDISTSGTLDTTIAGIFMPTMDIAAKSQVQWGMKKLELALALDNTGSMDSKNKMENLKTAAKSLLDTLKKAENKSGDVKIAVIPFATDVNIGSQNANATWIDWSGWEDNNGSCSEQIPWWKNKTRENCDDEGGDWTPRNHTTWNGCVWDRQKEHDVKNTAAATGSTRYSAHQASNCPVPMLPLTSNWTSLYSKVSEMKPVGNTNVTIGLQVAFQALSPVAPFNAASPTKDLDKVIILLTDGENTQNRWTSKTSDIDARTQKACDNADAANIKVYSIRVIDGNANLLRECATKSDMYYDVQDASQLNNVFSAIAQNLASLRLAK